MPTTIEKNRKGLRMHPMPLGDLFYDDIDQSNYFTVVDRPRNKVQSQDDAYYLFMKNWNELLFPSIQEYKALVIDTNYRCHYEVAFQEHRKVEKQGAETFFKKIKALGSGLHVVIGQNHPYKPFEVDDQTLRTSHLFKVEAQKIGVPVIDHLVISKMGYFALPGFDKFYAP